MTIKSKLFLATLLTLIALTAFAIISVPLKVSSQLLEKHHEEVIKKAQEEKFNAWLGALAQLECRNCKEHYRRIDSNGLYSYGCLQFQEATFKSMARKYGVDTGGNTDSIYSCEVQKRIASAMFKDDRVAASRHWYNSIYTKGLGLPPSL